jgi:hypothetical protein
MGFSIGSSLFDFATDAWSKNEDQKHADTQAWVQRNYQAGREDSAYQRTVADLNKAGLSPMLAYSKGASAVSTSPTAGGGQAVKSDLSGGMLRSEQGEVARQQSSLLKEEIQTQKSLQNLNNSSALKAQTEAYHIAGQTSQGLTAAQIEQLKAAAAQHGATAEQLKALEDRLRQEININRPPERFATEEPEKAKWMSPLFQSLNEIFKGVGALRGNSATINTTTTYPDGSKSTKTTKRK